MHYSNLENEELNRFQDKQPKKQKQPPQKYMRSYFNLRPVLENRIAVLVLRNFKFISNEQNLDGQQYKD